MTALILAEHNNTTLNLATYAVVTAAQQLTDKITVLVAGDNCASVVEQASKLVGVTKVLAVNHAAYQYGLAENVAALIHSLAAEYQYLLAAATTFGKNIMPRVAALLDVPQISDIIAIEAADCFVRPIYAGNAIETVQALAAKKIITIRATAFARCTTTDTACVIQELAAVFDLQLSQFMQLSAAASDRPDLATAQVVIAGGRGLQSKENFQLIEQLADKLQAAIGASRAAVDAGFIANDHQVGQTGKVVAPELYIAVGISGAVQHLAGMKDSKVIVAINKDSDAPIFQIADYGLVGDLFKILPELIEAL